MENIKIIFKKRNLILFLIIAIGAFLRFYRLPAYIEFLGDQGRDVLQVRDFLVNQDLMFIGPRTSAGDMYLGPWYYYLMAPFLLLANFSPIGPVVMVILFNLAGVYLLYQAGTEWFSRRAGIMAAGLGALSPVLIKFSTFSWNPNIMPFFSLLSVWLTYRIWHNKEYKKLIWLGVSLAMVLNSHYLGLLLFPVIGFFIFLRLIRDIKSKNKARLIKNLLLSLGVFGALMSPLLIFDLKHGWLNLNSFINFFVNRQNSTRFSFSALFGNFIPIARQITSQLVLNQDQGITGLILILILFYGFSQAKKNKAILVVNLSLIFGLLGLAIYNQPLYSHYFGFIYPVLILSFSYLLSRNKILAWLSALVILGIMFSNWHGWNSPNYQLQRTRQIAQLIINKSDNQPFGLALLAENNYDDSYEYLLKKNKSKLIDLHENEADQLFVICEYEDKSECKPLGNPKWEVAVFGVADLDQKWEVDGVNIYRLVRKGKTKAFYLVK